MTDDRHRSEDRPPTERPQPPRSGEVRPEEERRLRYEEQYAATNHEYNTVIKVIEVIYYLTGALGILLLLRFLLRLFGANPDNAFAQFIYGFSDPFTAPFEGLFANPAIGQYGVLEITVVIGIAVYALLTWLVVRLIKIIWLEDR